MDDVDIKDSDQMHKRERTKASAAVAARAGKSSCHFCCLRLRVIDLPNVRDIQSGSNGVNNRRPIPQ